MKKLLLFIPVFVGLLYVTSCEVDDDDSSSDTWLVSATVVKSSGTFYITTDSGDNLFPSESYVDSVDLVNGMRLLVNYTILGNATDSELYDYYVIINGAQEILTKPIFNFSEETPQYVVDSIGNDAITIKDAWVLGDYLNVEFEYGGGGDYVHYINLVYSSKLPETSDGALILELTHNKNSDSNNILQWGIASFDISDLQKTNESSVDILVRCINKDGEYDYNKVFTYGYNGITKWAVIKKGFDENVEGSCLRLK